MNASSLPRWIDIGLLPVLNLIAALTVAGVIIAIIGENPFVAMGAVSYTHLTLPTTLQV